MKRFRAVVAPAVFTFALAGCPNQAGSENNPASGSNNDTVTAGEVVTADEGDTVVAGTGGSNPGGGESENGALDTGDAFEGLHAELAQQILNIVNDERAAAGLPALTHSRRLSEAAQVHATDMAVNNFFSHTGSDDSNIGLRIDRVGYDWGFVGENIAYGPGEADAVMTLWMNSTGHRANILNEHFTEIGVGIDFSTGTRYWVQDFGHQR